MRMHSLTALVFAALFVAGASGTATAQAPAAPAQGPAVTVCEQSIAPPDILPPAGSGPIVWLLAPCFLAQGGSPTIEVETYMYYIRLRTSRPRESVWLPYDENTEQTILSDFKALWGTNFLEDLSIDVTDYTFANGVVGKIVVYNMEERERVKIVDYRDGKGESVSIIKRADIDEKLRERSIEIRLDSFLDESNIRRVKGVLDEMMAEKGFTNAEISHKVSEVAGGPKLVNITFTVNQGPKLKIRDVEFTGNSAIGDGTLQRKMKENKPRGLLSWITGSGTYKEAEFEEDAAKVVDHYQNKGYARARVGNPEIRIIEDSTDGDTRWVQLRIPVQEGPRYRFGDVTFEGNKKLTGDQLRALFNLEPGEWFNRKQLMAGRDKAREIYGAAGHMEFTASPMPKYSDVPDATDAALNAQVPDALAAPDGSNGGSSGGPNGAAKAETRPQAPTVDVTMLVEEGPQYFVNRITFTGNTTTRDNVIRREMRLVEGNVFDTEALKYSVRRLNQLGYFKQLEGNERDLDVKKTPGRDDAVDVTVRLEEQNRNQLTFGAGVSQYEGVFGQLAFQTSNFMGRGESLTLQMTAGDRSQNYQLAFTEPFLFDRNITGGFDIYKRSLDYIGYYTQKSTGGNLMFGFPVADFSRMFVQYAYETVRMGDLSEAFIDPSCIYREGGCAVISPSNLSALSEEAQRAIQRNPFLVDSLLLGQGGRRSISKIVPSFVHNTVDNPIFPNTGKRVTASIDLAGMGGNTAFYKPSVEAIFFKRHLARTSFGGRAQFQFIAPYRGTTTLPIFERLYLGGEYSVRGFDIRSIGPSSPEAPGVVLGGNKSLLFNGEYLISIVNQVRIVLFYDAGQVRDSGQSFGWKEDLIEYVFPPPLTDPETGQQIPDPNGTVTTRVIGKTSAFKTSTGIELRFFMPVLNVPFRLIYAWNPQREGVLDNNFRPQKETVFRFAVGTTF